MNASSKITSILRWADVLLPEDATLSDREAHADRVGMLYKQAMLAYTVSFINACVVAAVHWNLVSTNLIFCWMALGTIVAALRIMLVHRYDEKTQTLKESEVWARRYLIGAAANGAVWGLAGIIFFSHGSLIHQVFLAFVLGGTAAGGMALLSAIRGAAVIFITATLLPVSIHFFFFDRTTHLAMGFLSCLFLLTLIRSTIEINKTISTSLKLRHKNRQLIDKLQAASEVKTMFLANMSHEIRTPMNGILGMTDHLLESDLSAEQRKSMELVKQSADSLLTIINDILDVSKIEVGKLAISPTWFELRVEFEKVLALIELKAREKKIQYVYNVEEEVPNYIYADLTRVGQILINLVGNAIKFTPEGGAVMFHIFQEEKTDSGVRLKFVVADTGIGIQEAKLKEIFDSFTQADSSITREFGGTGLGLTISSLLVDLMNGSISVDSQQGMGTVFTVRLTVPFSQSRPDNTEMAELTLQAQTNTPTNSSVDNGSSAHILLAEDNMVNQLLAVRILESAGYKVSVAQNGREAIELLGSDHFDAVLMDCQMPELSGYEATAIIRASDQSSKSQIPIIALTAHAMAGDKERCIEAGMNDYLAKPLDKALLIETLERHIES